MNSAMIHPVEPCNNLAPLLMEVYVDLQRRPELLVGSLSVKPGPEFASAVLTVALAQGDLVPRRIEELPMLPATGSAVRITTPGPARQVIFEGFISRQVGCLGEQEQLHLEANDLLAVRLGGTITGRWDAAASPVLVPTAACVFNDEHEGLASADKFTIFGRQCRAFAPVGGQLWSVADMLAYLLACHAPAEVAVPSAAELEDLAGEIYPGRLALSGLPIGQALAKVAGQAGLATRGIFVGEGDSGGRGIEFYRPGQDGRRISVSLQSAGESLDIRRSNLWQGRLAIRRQAPRAGVLVLGELKRYQCTLQLHGGWDPAQQSCQYRDFVRGESADWPAVADVYRKWVLNEAGQYSNAPFNLPPFDFATINADDFLTARPRRLSPCLSADSAGHSLGVVVEISCDGGTTWRRHGGPVRLAAHECSVYLADDALPADFFQANLAALARVRVTATVSSDRHLSAQVPGDEQAPVEVVHVPTARWAKVHGQSVFGSPAAESDDTARLSAIAAAQASSAGGDTEAQLSLGWVEPSLTVGDIVEQIAGRGLDLALPTGRCPHVAAVEHLLNEEWTTRLVLVG